MKDSSKRQIRIIVNIIAITCLALMAIALILLFGGSWFAGKYLCGKTVALEIAGKQGNLVIGSAGISPLSGFKVSDISFKLGDFAEISSGTMSVGWSLPKLGRLALESAHASDVDFSVDLEKLMDAFAQSAKDSSLKPVAPTTAVEPDSPVIWSIQSFVLMGKGKLRYKTVELDISKFRLKGISLTHEMQGTLHLDITTSDGATVSAVVLLQRLNPTIELSGENVDMQLVSDILKEFGAGYAQFSSGKLTVKTLWANINDSVISANLSLSTRQASVAVAGWGTRNVDVDITTGLSFSDGVLKLDNLKLSEPATQTVITGDIEYQDELVVKNLDIAVGDAWQVVNNWGLAAYNVMITGNVSYKGDFSLAFPFDGPVIRANGNLVAKAATYNPVGLKLLIEPSDLNFTGSFSWKPTEMNIATERTLLTTEGVCTKFMAYVSSKAASGISGNLKWKPSGLTTDFKLAQGDTVTIEGNIALSAKNAISGKVSLSAPDVTRLPAVFFHPETKKILTYIQPDKAPISLTADLSTKDGLYEVSYICSLPATTLMVGEIADSFQSADINGKFYISPEADTKITVFAKIHNLSSFGDTSFRAGVRLDPNGDISIKVRELASPFTNFSADIVFRGDSLAVSSDWDSINLTLVEQFALAHGFGAEYDFELKGDIGKGSFKLDKTNYSASLNLSSIRFAYANALIENATGQVSVLGDLNSPLPSRLDIPSFIVDTIKFGDSIIKSSTATNLTLLVEKVGEQLRFTYGGTVGCAKASIHIGEILDADNIVIEGSANAEYLNNGFNISSANIRLRSGAVNHRLASATLASIILTTGEGINAGVITIAASAASLTGAGMVGDDVKVDGYLSILESVAKFSGSVSSSNVAYFIGNQSVKITDPRMESKVSFDSSSAELLISSNANFTFGSGTVEVIASSSANNIRVHLIIDKLTDALNSCPSLCKLLDASFDGSLVLDGSLIQKGGASLVEGTITIALPEYSFDSVDAMGESFEGAIKADISFDKDMNFGFDLSASFVPGLMLASAYFFEIEQPVDVMAKGVYSMQTGDLNLSLLQVTYAPLFASMTLTSLVAKNDGTVRFSGGITGLDLNAAVKFIYTDQLAEGTKPLYIAKEVVDVDLSCIIEDGLHIEMTVKGTEFYTSIKPFIGGTPVEFQSATPFTVSAVWNKPLSGPITCKTNLSATKLTFAYGNVLGEFENISLDNTILLSGSDYLLSGNVKATGFAVVQGVDPDLDILSLRDFDIDLPFRLSNSVLVPADIQSGRFAVKEFSLTGYRTTDFSTALTLWDNYFKVDEPLNLISGDSSIFMTNLEMADVTLPSRVGMFSLNFNSVKTETLLSSVGIKAFPGIITGSLEADIVGSRISLTGSTTMNAFNGTMVLTDPYLVFAKYPQYGFRELIITDLDLFDATRNMEGYAASVSGNLCGYIRNYAGVFDEPSRFELWLHTVPKSGRKQVITAGIVNVIAMNSSEVRSAMQLFNLTRFKYEYIKIGASLKNGRFRLSSAPDGAPVAEDESVLLKGKRSGFFRLILRVAGNVEGDWSSIWKSFKEGLSSMGSEDGLEVVR